MRTFECKHPAPATRRPASRWAPAAAAWLLSGALLGGVPLAHADDAVNDETLIKILEKLRDEQKQEFTTNVDRWQEVSDLLAKYVDYSKAEEVRHQQWQQNQALLSKAEKDDFANTFKGLAGGLRDVKGTDMSSKAVASGLKSAGAGAGTGLKSLGEIGKLIGAFTGGDTEDLITSLKDGTFLSGNPDALRSVMAMFKVEDIKELGTLVESANAGRPNEKVLNQATNEALQRVKFRSDTAGNDLAQVQQTAAGAGSRLAAIEALVQQTQALGSAGAKGEPSFDATKLAELRSYLTSISAMQNEELIKLSAKEMGDRASENLNAAATTARTLETGIQRANNK
jgi:hypothetical protein